MSAPHWLVPLLRCPETHLPLTLTVQGLVRQDGHLFANREEIPSLVYPPLTDGEDARLNRFYDRIAPFYDFVERVVGRILTGVNMTRGRQQIVDRLGLKPGMRLLEVSPGPGVFQPMLRSAVGPNAEIAALDLSFNMLCQCRLRHSDLGIALLQGNGQYLPFADASFDALFHFGGVNLFNEPERALNEFVRVVRPGGLVSWRDEAMSEHYHHPIGRRALPRLNPGFRKTPPAMPAGLVDVQRFEVYDGLGYMITARRG